LCGSTGQWRQAADRYAFDHSFSTKGGISASN